METATPTAIPAAQYRALTNVITDYDRRYGRGNIYMLGHLAGALNDCDVWVAAGHSLATALKNNFAQPLRGKLEKAAGLPVSV